MTSQSQRYAFFLVTLFIVFIFVPFSAEAATYSGSYRTKVNRLDNSIVKNLPIPILFGVSLKAVTPNFGDPRDGGARSHEGLDIMAKEGAPIVSPTASVVLRTGNASGSGKYVTTANPGGETFVYMHLSEILVKSGQELKVGDLIGYVGSTGNAVATAPHLHLEIRKDRKALDPYPRITQEFTLKEKISFLADLIEDANDEEELIKFLTEHYSGVFYQAEAEGLLIPKDIKSALPKTGSAPTIDLQPGSSGEMVIALQSILIRQGYLLIDTPTGNYGPMTTEAVKQFQIAKGITPANGFYGPVTRAALSGAAPATLLTTKEMEEKIAELNALIKKLTEDLKNT